MLMADHLITRYGGMAALKRDYIRLENPPYMRLVIEHIGKGPRNGDLVSVAHYYEQNGDAMRDPEIVFEVVGDIWYPISIQQDGLPTAYREAVWQEDDGRVMMRPKLCKEIAQFARTWDRNLREQGFGKLPPTPARVTVMTANR